MAVVGVDIGDHSTHIAVARLGGVDTITNEYSMRSTPSIVSLGAKQRLMGVSAENQRNLSVRNSVSYFKNLLGRSFKDPYVSSQQKNVGADIVEMKDGKLGYKVGEKTYLGEQVLAMMLTKVRDIVRADQGEDIETCVISVPQHFSQTQRLAVLDAASIAGLHGASVMSDTAALALAYGKSRPDLPDEASGPRYVVLVDSGCGGLQCSMVAVTKDRALVLGSASSTATGGKVHDQALVEYLVTEIEAKHKCELRNNPKALNKLRLAAEKIKKQMSANSNKLPLQIENLVEDIDVNISLERAKFEELIEKDLSEVRKIFNELLNSTTVKKEHIHSVEIVGGSSRIPAIRNDIQEVFGVQPSYSLNADEAVSKGCGLMAAALSNKFRTRDFDVQEIVKDAIEAVYTHEGNQERMLIFDEGERASEERVINFRADLPLHIAVQYGENVDVDNKFICLYQLTGEPNKNVDLELVFGMSQNGLVKMDRAFQVPKDETKRRKTNEHQHKNTEQRNQEEAGSGNDARSGSRTEIKFSKTELGGLPGELVTHLRSEEEKMIVSDKHEVARQEAKNSLEENLYKYRSELSESEEGLEEEENTKKIKKYFEDMETWLYEEGEEAAEQTYKDNLQCLSEQVELYKQWRTQFLQAKAREEQQKRYLEQQQQQQRRPNSGIGGGRPSRQIPVVYEGVGPYTQSRPQSAPREGHRNSPGRFEGYRDAEYEARPEYQGYRPQRDEFEGFSSQQQQGHRPRDLRRQMMEDPFFSRSSLSGDRGGGPLFGYGW